MPPAGATGLLFPLIYLDTAPRRGEPESSWEEIDISSNEGHMLAPRRKGAGGEALLAEVERSASQLILRMPRAEDGPRVTALITASPPLDTNSAYCNLLQCTDFRETCVLAERDGEVVGWISAYRPPTAQERLFVWQVAVDRQARGEGLAARMLDELIARPAAASARTLTTTITQDNDASWALFQAFARRHGATLTKRPRFEREAHFAGAHDTEWEACIALPRVS